MTQVHVKHYTNYQTTVLQNFFKRKWNLPVRLNSDCDAKTLYSYKLVCGELGVYVSYSLHLLLDFIDI